MRTLETGIAVVGAGVCGLALCDALSAQGHSVTLLEARSRVGGRVESWAEGSHRYDTGPAWIWPHNHRMLELVTRLHLPLMEQHATGKLIFEDRQGGVQRNLDIATMAGALRVQDGLARLPEAIADGLPDGILHLGHRVTHLSAEGEGVRLSGTSGKGAFDVMTQQVVLALPPRLAATELIFSPRLEDATQRSLKAVPTWMAGQGKLVAVYGRPFWRKAGLSGDAISHRGPLAEIHDASPMAEPEVGALFGFVHPDVLRAGLTEPDLIAAALEQLGRYFGKDAASPQSVHVKLWSEDPLTATSDDRAAPTEHPVYRPVPVRGTAWAGRLLLSGSETAAEDGGFLEGALAAAEQTLAEIGSASALAQDGRRPVSP